MPMQDIATTLTNAARANPDTMKEASWMEGQLLPQTARGFADISDHALHVAEGVDGLRDTMGGLMDTNLSLADVRLNTVMKKLASWAAVIAVPTFITGFMGMNVPYPGFASVWGVVGSVSLIVATVAWLIWFFHKRDWL
jgi:magnesium transporter